MLRTNNTGFSDKQLKATEDALQEVITTTAGLAGSFGLLEKVAQDGACPLDPSTLAECRQMTITVNRMLCELRMELDHLSLMRSVDQSVNDELLRLRASSNMHNQLNS